MNYVGLSRPVSDKELINLHRSCVSLRSAGRQCRPSCKRPQDALALPSTAAPALSWRACHHRRTRGCREASLRCRPTSCRWLERHRVRRARPHYWLGTDPASHSAQVQHRRQAAVHVVCAGHAVLPCRDRPSGTCRISLRNHRHSDQDYRRSDGGRQRARPVHCRRLSSHTRTDELRPHRLLQSQPILCDARCRTRLAKQASGNGIAQRS